MNASSITFFFICLCAILSAQDLDVIVKEVEKIESQITSLQDDGDFLACLPFYRKIQYLYKKQKDWENYINQYCYMGMTCWQAGQYSEMGTYLDSALYIAQEKNIEEQSDTYATIWSYSGFYYESLGDADASLDAFKKTFTIDKYLYDNKAVDFDTTYLAFDLISLGAWYNNRGDYKEARNNLYEALLYLPNNDVNVSRIYNNIGYSYQGESAIDLAKTNYKKALFQLRLCSESTEQKETYVLTYNNLAALYSSQNKVDSAYYYLSKLKSIIPENWKTDLADYYQLLGNTDALLNNYVSAEKHTKKALNLKQEAFGSKHYEAAISYKNLGRIYAEQLDYELALNYYQQALVAISPKFNDSISYSMNPNIEDVISHRIELLGVLNFKSQVLRKVNNLKATKSTLKLAIQLIDQIRYNYLAEGSKYALLERAMPIYEQAIDLALEMGDEEWAYEVAERSKATLLLESVKNAEAQTFAGIAPELLEQEREQKVQIAFYERLLNEAEAEEDRTEYQRELFDLKQNYQSFLEKLEQEYPDYYALKYAVSYPTVSEIQQNLLNEQTALIEYFTGDSSIYVFVITQNNFKVQKIEKSDDFAAQLNALRSILSNPQNDSSSFQTYTKNAFEIYTQYVKPVLKNLAVTVNELILIPDGQLSYIPFQALIRHPIATENSSDPRFDTLSYLVQDYAISYAYSSTLLMDNQEDKKNNKLVFGGFAPVFTGGKAIALHRDEQLNELPHSRTEVEQIEYLLAGKTYFEQQANLKDFKKYAADFNILHLSTHAAIDDENPSQSRIHLFDDYITVHEIYNLPIQADLTVLSACETGVGEYKRGEGMLSLARAFMYAGCPSLVTSLWQVNDEATANLMFDFYEALKDGQSKASALQQAQLKHLSNANMSVAHPFYWAAFVQTGNREALVDNFRDWWIGSILGIGILLMIGFAWNRLKKTHTN